MAYQGSAAPTDAEAPKEFGEILWDGSTFDASFTVGLFDLALACCLADNKDREWY